MMRQNGPWKIKRTATKYKNDLMEVCEDEVVKPDGSPGTYATVRLKAGSSVLPVDDEGFVYLARDFRYAVGRETVETAGGAMDEGESPLDAARRELKEELGIEAGEFFELGTVDPVTSLIDSPAHLFLATGLAFKEKEQGAGENTKTVKVKLAEAVALAMRGEITHGTSCVLILRANHYLEGKSARARERA